MNESFQALAIARDGEHKYDDPWLRDSLRHGQGLILQAASEEIMDSSLPDKKKAEVWRLLDAYNDALESASMGKQIRVRQAIIELRDLARATGLSDQDPGG